MFTFTFMLMLMLMLMFMPIARIFATLPKEGCQLINGIPRTT
jgi:hypothetical protein